MKTMPEKEKVVGARSPGVISQKALMRVVPPKPFWLGEGPAGQAVWFLVKVAALETVRRLSEPRCPLVWRAIQASQVLCYPPFKWIQRWSPFRVLINCVQKFSRPLLFLSITTAFTDCTETCNDENIGDDTQSHCETPSRPSTPNIRNNDVSSKDVVSENWLIQLQGELEKQGIVLPERINEDELQRFYTAANGDFSCLLASVKKTIQWRVTYYILPPRELEMWSHLVFWHGFDVMLRPCLVIRLGLACCSLMPEDRPRFAQAIVSQLEHGVLYLLNEQDPQVTVLMDCEGLSPIRFPMHMMRSCSTLLQDHYPNRLGTLFVLRLPPVVRVIAQTFIQVLRPTTRQKLRIEGETYKKVLSEFLQTVPSFLGGECTCSKCRMLLDEDISGEIEENGTEEPGEDALDGAAYPVTELPMTVGCENTLRTVIVAFLMLWVLITVLSGMHDDPESLSSSHP